MGESSCCLLLTLALAASGCAKTQMAAPNAQTAAPNAQTAAPNAQTAAPAAPSTACAVPASQAEAAAMSSAETWLALIDQGNYLASWDTAAALFQRALARTEWASTVLRVRGPLGKLVSRQTQSAKFLTSLPGVPDGKYVVITLSAAFENKEHAVETVTSMQDESGAWRVAGYYIKCASERLAARLRSARALVAAGFCLLSTSSEVSRV